MSAMTVRSDGDLVSPEAQDSVGVRWPRAHVGGSTWRAVALSLAIVAGLMSVLFLRNHRYYYIDDRVTDAVPKLMDIGRILRSGEWPWLSTNVVNSGGHAVEYQNNVFNPLNLALSIPLSQADDLATGAFLYILVHGMLLTGAAAWLGRSLGLSTAWTVTFAVSCGFQPYSIVWGAAAWMQTFVSFCWFMLAVAAAVAFHANPRRRYGWTLLVATYGCCTAGFPLAIIMLGLFGLALVVARLVARSDVRQTAWIAAWLGGGVVCALIALYPLIASFEFASRTSTLVNSSNFNVVSLDHLLQFANPGYYAFFNNFGGYELQRLPHFYGAWIILPVLVFWKAERLRGAGSVLLKVAVALLAFSALMALGPERLSVFRFPTRMVQYYEFSLLLTAVLLVAHGRFVFSRQRFYVLLALLAVMLTTALQADPAGLLRVLPFGLLVAGLCAAVWWQGQRRRVDAGSGARRRGAAVDLTLVGGTALVLLGLALAHPGGRGVDWGFPHEPSKLEALSRDDYTLYYGNYLPPEGISLEGFSEFHPSTMGLMVGDRQINGYSPLGHRFFREKFPIDDQGNFQPGGAQGFTQTDPATGLSYLELFRVDQVIALKGPMEDELSASLGPSWRLDRQGRFTGAYVHRPYELPGLVSYASPGIDLAPVPGCPQQHSRECVEVTSSTDGPGNLVFARLWFPGYRATLDGEPLRIERHAGMLVSAVLPEGASGRVELTYTAPGFRELASLALLTLAGLAFASVRLRQSGGAAASRPVRAGSAAR